MAIYLQEATYDLPKIELNDTTGICSFEGKSIPKDAFVVYNPVVNWINNYIESPQQKTILNFRFNYFNTGTSKFIFDIMQRMLALKEKNLELEINWFCPNNDDDFRVLGKKYMNLLDYKINIH